MLKKLIFASTLLCAGVAFASTLHAGDSVRLHGRLELRGNEPFVYPVVNDKTGIWTLKGVSRSDAAKLQNHVVSVRATVLPENAMGPAAKVRTIKVDEPE